LALLQLLQNQLQVMLTQLLQQQELRVALDQLL
jgi:hypothetical protein